jgi:hypothetical protein
MELCMAFLKLEIIGVGFIIGLMAVGLYKEFKKGN